MAQLPSYPEATSRQWHVLVSPYVSVGDYASLCLVNRAFYEHFAPCLWKDPVQVALRMKKIDPRDISAVFRWLETFFAQCSQSVRRASLRLVLCVDLSFLLLSRDPHGSWATDSSLSSGLAETYRGLTRFLPGIFPCLRCVLLDGHPAFNSTTFSLESNLQAVLAPDQHRPRPVLLSARHGHASLSVDFLVSSYLRDLVFLDLSFSPDSVAELGRALRYDGVLSSLSILKVQGCKMNDQTASMLVDAFHGRLWSLDLSNNQLTDGFLEHLMKLHLQGDRSGTVSLRTGLHFDVEGKQVQARHGSYYYGGFTCIVESEYSADFNHPQRHLVDPPGYTADVQDHLPSGELRRHDGRKRAKPDSCDRIKHIFLGGSGVLPFSENEMQKSEILSQGAITHLYLNGNNFSARQVTQMLRESSGQLELFECDTAKINIPLGKVPSWFPRTASLFGLLGSSYLFRPVLSVNLQALRVHHSLVTHIPSLQADGIPIRQCQWLAENAFEKRASMAYPQVFTPDTNPRLQSLTLTGVPQYSSGPLIKKLIKFLELASVQEQDIEKASVGSAYRRPVTVRGLRHLRIELTEDPGEDVVGLEDFHELDAEGLASLDSTGFSFFGDAGWQSSTVPSGNADSATILAKPDMATPASGSMSTPISENSNVPPYISLKRQYPFNKAKDDCLTVAEGWGVFTIPTRVWVGSGIPGPNQAVNEYMRALLRPECRKHTSPASPSHVIAGVPARSYLYQAAWDAILFPPDIRRPSRKELNEMGSVISAIKEYRNGTRAALEKVQREAGTMNVPLGGPHYHWTGTLEVSFPK